MYSTDLVHGDTVVTVRELEPGDVLRMFNGLQDTVTIASIENLGTSQYGGHQYHIHFHDGSVSRFVRGGDTRHLATGGPRLGA